MSFIKKIIHKHHHRHDGDAASGTPATVSTSEKDDKASITSGSTQASQPKDSRESWIESAQKSFKTARQSVDGMFSLEQGQTNTNTNADESDRASYWFYQSATGKPKPPRPPPQTTSKSIAEEAPADIEQPAAAAIAAPAAKPKEPKEKKKSIAERARERMDSARRRAEAQITGDEEASRTVNEIRCGMTFSQRVKAAFVCYCTSLFLSLLATMSLRSKSRDLKGFAVLYLVAQLLAITSSCFIVGPRKQVSVMFDPIRRISCCVFLGSTVTTVILAFALPANLAFIVMIMILVQYSAMFWYYASYVPYGRATILRCFRKIGAMLHLT